MFAASTESASASVFTTSIWIRTETSAAVSGATRRANCCMARTTNTRSTLFATGSAAKSGYTPLISVKGRCTKSILAKSHTGRNRKLNLGLLGPGDGSPHRGEEVRALTVRRFGPPAREVGSGIQMNNRMWDGGILTFHPFQGPTFQNGRQRSALTRFIVGITSVGACPKPL